MAAGRRPPIIPRNSLAEGRIAGRKPPLPYKLAVMKRHEQRRMERGMAGIAAIGGAKAPPRQVSMLAAFTAVDPVRERGLERAGKVIRKAQDRAMREAEAAEAAAVPTLSTDLQAGDAQAEPRTTRPPKPKPGRYDGLKDGQPG